MYISLCHATVRAAAGTGSRRVGSRRRNDLLFSGVQLQGNVKIMDTLFFLPGGFNWKQLCTVASGYTELMYALFFCLTSVVLQRHISSLINPLLFRMCLSNMFVLTLQLHSNMDKGEGNVKYVLTGEGAGTLFLIDEKSGDIHATKRLDREEKAMYTLVAKVLDRNTNAELEPDTEFNIKIHDINDNEPKFAKDIYFASVPEMSEVGELWFDFCFLTRELNK